LNAHKKRGHQSLALLRVLVLPEELLCKVVRLCIYSTGLAVKSTLLDWNQASKYLVGVLSNAGLFKLK
jgi:hypothetical protein